jgi:lysozyme family protein
MANMLPPNPLRAEEFNALFQSCQINPEKLADVQAIITRILAKQDRYQAVEDDTQVPWYVVAIIHSLEADLNFGTHLHNGDPLPKATTHVPRGRPTGVAPFTWIESAVDALNFDGLPTNREWSVACILNCLEEYNGTGYRRLANPIPSPYLWSYSNHYQKGKFDADGHFNPAAISVQCGGAVLLKHMAANGYVALRAQMVQESSFGIPTTAANPAYPGFLINGQTLDKAAITILQERLNQVGCGPVDANGIFDEKTQYAVMLFQMRHTDNFGRELEIDGEVGSLTWGSLFGNGTVPQIVLSPTTDLAADAVSVAQSQIGVLEQPLGSNRGPEVEQYQAAVGIGKGEPWCAAFAYWCFQQAAISLKRVNPVIKTGSVVEHWDLARKNGIPVVMTPSARQNPELLKPGMLFIMATGGGTGHTGIVEKIVGGRIVTIEGNTNDNGSREGIGVFRRTTRNIASINRGFIDYSNA